MGTKSDACDAIIYLLTEIQEVKLTHMYTKPLHTKCIIQNYLCCTQHIAPPSHPLLESDLENIKDSLMVQDEGCRDEGESLTTSFEKGVVFLERNVESLALSSCRLMA